MVILKTDAEIEQMREAGRLAAQTLDMIEPFVKPGVSTLELNDICHEFTIKNGAVPAPLNYHGFPKSICTSINEVVCHGIPNKKQKLKDGDIINIDVTPILNGFHGDTSKTFLVGKVADPVKNLVRTTQECLDRAIAIVRPGARIGDIGATIQSHAEKNGYSVVRDFVGHGIGRGFHEAPQVQHFGSKGRGIRLVKGMVFTIEPMINMGHHGTQVKSDGWTAVTSDRSMSAQFEHTIAIKNNGDTEILTLP